MRDRDGNGTGDDFAVHSSAATRIGRIRPPSEAELASPDSLLRPDAVLAISAPPPLEASDFEVRVASLIDAVRPVARIKKKSGLTSADTRTALAALRGRKLLLLVGIVEETVGPWAEDIENEIAERRRDETTVPRGNAAQDYIPPHVMAEIQAMLEEEERQRIASQLMDDDTSFDADTKERTAELKPKPRG